jgi:hypothetical protein
MRTTRTSYVPTDYLYPGAQAPWPFGSPADLFKRATFLVGFFVTVYNLDQFLIIINELADVMKLVLDISALSTFAEAADLLRSCPHSRHVHIKIRCFNLVGFEINLDLRKVVKK